MLTSTIFSICWKTLVRPGVGRSNKLENCNVNWGDLNFLIPSCRTFGKIRPCTSQIFHYMLANFFDLWSLHLHPSDLKHMQNIILLAQIFSKKINVFEALKNDRSKYHTWISERSCVPLVVRSEDSEIKIVTVRLLIHDHSSELYGQIVGNLSIKD